MQNTLEQYKKTTAITNKQLNELMAVSPRIEQACAASESQSTRIDVFNENHPTSQFEVSFKPHSGFAVSIPKSAEISVLQADNQQPSNRSNVRPVNPIAKSRELLRNLSTPVLNG